MWEVKRFIWLTLHDSHDLSISFQHTVFAFELSRAYMNNEMLGGK